MNEYWLSVSRNGKFLFRTAPDNHAKVLEAADVISKGCPDLKVMLYSRSLEMTSVEYAQPKVVSFTTKLRNIHLVDRSDGLEDVYDKLLGYQEVGLDVLVIQEGAIGYFDVQLPDLTYVSALSAYHLAQTPDEE